MINSTDKNNVSSSLEDRHFLSDPRPVPNLDLPTWEVDVHREGVDQPILTLRVDSKVLPPRKKKKKTLWKLPDSIDMLPKFGEQDKRRILELFREKKKELKKLKNKQRAYRRASSMEAMSTGGGAESAGGNSGTNKPNPADSTPPASMNLPPENGRHDPPNVIKSKVGNDVRDDSSISPPGFGKLSISDGGNTSTSSLPLAPPPPGIPASSTLKPAPPGLSLKNQEQMNGHQSSSYQNGLSPSNASSSFTTPPPGLQEQQQHPPQYSHQPTQSPLSLPGILPGLMNGHQQPKYEPSLPPKAIGPCFVLPPEAPPGASIGKIVTESYYLLLQSGMIRELDDYYYRSSKIDDKAGGSDDVVYKALMVGGAHAVCASPQDRLVQLQTFAGCEMRIKGVQQQPTIGKGILVLITGVSIRTTAPSPGSNQQTQQQLPFCHTLILKPVSTTTAVNIGSNLTPSAATTPTIGYQILNDNLVILTGEE